MHYFFLKLHFSYLELRDQDILAIIIFSSSLSQHTYFTKIECLHLRLYCDSQKKRGQMSYYIFFWKNTGKRKHGKEKSIKELLLCKFLCHKLKFSCTNKFNIKFKPVRNVGINKSAGTIRKTFSIFRNTYT